MSFAAIAVGVVAAGAAAYSAYSASEIYGDKPEVAPAPTVKGIITDTLDANISGLPKAAGLASSINDFDQDRILKNLRNVVGGDFLDEGSKLVSENILSGLRGEVDNDAVQNFAASRSLGNTGNSLFDSGVGRNRVARDIALSEREIKNQAAGSYKEWLAASRALLAPNISAASFLATPGMGQSVANNSWDIGDYMAKINAAPDPGTAGAFNTSLSLITSLATAYGRANSGPNYGFGNSTAKPWLGSAGSDFTLGQASQMYGNPSGGGVLGSFYGGG